MSKYIDPFTDFGFKYIFGQKKFLIAFLNSLFENSPGCLPIVDVEYKDKELNRVFRERRGVIYDIHCTTSDGKVLIVEMQNGSQEFFADRTRFYIARSIVEQGKAGHDWNFQLAPVYLIALINFKMDVLGERLRTDIAPCILQTCEPFTNKERSILINLPEFSESDPDKCKSKFDQWIYTLKNMKTMDAMPFTTNPVFKSLSSWAEYAALSEADRHIYDSELQVMRDYTNQLNYQFKQGKVEGRAEERAEILHQLAASGMSAEQIAKALEMDVDEVENIINGSSLR